MEFRLRPEDDYILNAGFPDILELTYHWEVEINQILAETKFFKTILEEFSRNGSSSMFVDELNSLIQKNDLLESRIRMLASRIAMHIVHLEELIEQAYQYSEQDFRVKHERLEKIYAGVVVYFQSNKKKFFSAISD
jgi:predicted NACHT family NTPase